MTGGKRAGAYWKKLSGRQLYLCRLKREKRYHEWLSLVRTIMEDEGVSQKQAETKACRLMGFEGVQKERELAVRDSVLVSDTEGAAKKLEWQEKLSSQEHQLDFEGALRTLPNTAHPAVEMDWVRAHPAMARLARSKDKQLHVEITVDDVLRPPHGKAPSKGAVYILQNWCNRPMKFFEQMLAEQKKAISMDDRGSEMDPEADLQKVERRLRQVEGVSVELARAA